NAYEFILGSASWPWMNTYAVRCEPPTRCLYSFPVVKPPRVSRTAIHPPGFDGRHFPAPRATSKLKGDLIMALRLQRNKVATAVSLALAVTGASALAQDDTGREVEEIIVTGKYRASLIDSINTKRYSSSIVEAISAEDIGKQPDSSIAEAIARLPGLAGQRLDGRTSSISIRGLGEDFSSATLNGREQVSISDNRGIEFDLYPSEI